MTQLSYGSIFDDTNNNSMGVGSLFPTGVAVSGSGMDAAVNNSGGSTGGVWNSTPTGQIFNSKTGAIQKPGFFGKGGMAEIGIGAISTLGSLWNSFQQNKIAKKSLKLQERTFETNLRNQTKSYNTELEDRIRNRYDTERRGTMDANGDYGSAEADSYIEKNKL